MEWNWRGINRDEVQDVQAEAALCRAEKTRGRRLALMQHAVGLVERWGADPCMRKIILAAAFWMDRGQEGDVVAMEARWEEPG